MGTSTKATSSTNSLMVWVAMSEIFGNRWINDFGDTPPQLWTRKLSELSENEIKHGINKLMDSDCSYTPNLSQFVGLCKIEVIEDVYKQERETYARLTQQKPASSIEVRRAEIAKMKATLRGITS
jgi:hypothetical protein